MFVRNAWYVAAYSNEVAGALLARRICNEPLVMFRDWHGRVAALENKCCHRGTPLDLGEIVEQGIQCGYHGLIFDGTGKCVFIPGQSIIPERAKVRSYPVIEKDQMIWVWM